MTIFKHKTDPGLYLLAWRRIRCGCKRLEVQNYYTGETRIEKNEKKISDFIPVATR